MQKRKVVSYGILGLIALAVIFAVAQSLGPAASPPAQGRRGQAVAVVYLEGVIAGGRGQSSLLAAGGGTDSVIRQLRQAKEDPDVAAVVLRINSPGGTPAGSQEVYNEVLRVREAGKPVVVSFADMAASGGYLVACAADEIVANPSSITGSIGVIIEVTNLTELYDKLGIATDTVKSGVHKDMGSVTRPLGEDEREILQSMVDDIYEQFVQIVVQGRGLDEENVRELADGRIYTGRQALELGLVDRLGDMTDAVDAAGALAGIEGTPRMKEFGFRSPFSLFFGSGLSSGWPLATDNFRWFFPR